MKEKICVYTCITGGYDDLNEIENVEKGIDYYCFTNNKKIKSSTWNVVYVEDAELSNVQLARKIKILGHPLINNNYDILLWMDGAVVFKKNIKDFINKYLKKEDSFVAFKHGERNNVKEECNACVIARKEKQENVKKILKFFNEEKYMDTNGLIESTVYIKRPNDKVVMETMKLWFYMIKNYSHRDQLSFNYCIFKTGLKVKWINKKVFSNEWFKWKRHNPKSYNISKYRIYFGDISKYDSKYDIIKPYKIKDSVYTIEMISPYDTNLLYIEFTNIECTLLKSVKLNGKKISKCLFNNYVNFDEYKLFYERTGTLILHQSIHKGQKLCFEFEMEVKSGAELYDVIENLSLRYNCSNDEVEKITKQLNYYIKNYNQVINSKGWKLLEKLRKLKLSKN